MVVEVTSQVTRGHHVLMGITCFGNLDQTQDAMSSFESIYSVSQPTFAIYPRATI